MAKNFIHLFFLIQHKNTLIISKIDYLFHSFVFNYFFTVANSEMNNKRNKNTCFKAMLINISTLSYQSFLHYFWSIFDKIVDFITVFMDHIMIKIRSSPHFSYQSCSLLLIRLRRAYHNFFKTFHNSSVSCYVKLITNKKLFLTRWF